MKYLIFAILCTLSFACSPSFEGIKVRAQSPSISEASRRIGLALRADDYGIEKGSALGLYHVTLWRELKEVEKGKEEKEIIGSTEGRISVRLEPRGTNYDIFLTIILRNPETEYYPEPGHPIVVKLEKLLREIVTLEAKEE
jgi:hypothetical protein